MSRRPRQVGGGRGVTDPSRPRTERSAQPRTREERSGAPQRSAVKALREEPPHRTAPLPLPEGPHSAQRGDGAARRDGGSERRPADSGGERSPAPKPDCGAPQPTRPDPAPPTAPAAPERTQQPMAAYHPPFPPITPSFPSPSPTLSHRPAVAVALSLSDPRTAHPHSPRAPRHSAVPGAALRPL